MKRLVVSDLKLGIEAGEQELTALLKKRGIDCSDADYRIVRRSLDARDRSDIRYVYSVAFNAGFRPKGRITGKYTYEEPKAFKTPKYGLTEANGRHVIAGAGPAGLFAGLLLARNGYRPLIIERGSTVEKRVRDVDSFWSGGNLDPESNVCFGEGGAGTFSDGKLTTGVRDEAGREAFVLQTFADMGADPSVTYWYRPHIGTDVLRGVVRNIRDEIIRLGGEFSFDTRLDDIEPADRGPVLVLSRDGGTVRMKAASLILATGHSARDTYEMLLRRGARMEAKDFAVGVRIEHPQEMIQLAQYGTADRTHLPAADYRLAAKTQSGRGVYTFCMCPGGTVVDCSTEPGGVCVNGMSSSARDGRNANSAVIITVGPRDYGGSGPLAGIAFQRELELRAGRLGGGTIPMQLFSDFAAGCDSTGPRGIVPDIRGAWQPGRVDRIFEPGLTAGLIEGITAFGRRISGFDRPDAVLTGVEGRTSAPVRILRGENYESNIEGLFPCGEGAGYAGGITSAAMDGLRVAEEIIRRYRPC